MSYVNKTAKNTLQFVIRNVQVKTSLVGSENDLKTSVFIM